MSDCCRCGESEATWPPYQEVCGVPNTQVYCKPCSAEVIADNPDLTPRQRRRLKKRVLQGKY